MPTSPDVARSGSSAGLPRKNGDGLNDWMIVGSLMPRPTFAFSFVSALTRYANDTRGATAVPKLSFFSIRSPLESDACDPSHWCCTVQPKLLRDARTTRP